MMVQSPGVLLITAPVGDAHAQRVSRWLSARRVVVKNLSAGFYEHGRLAIEPTDVAEIIRSLGLERSGDHQRTIWSRRLTTNLPGVYDSQEIEELCREESRAITAGVLAILAVSEPNIRFVDKPAAMFLAEQKLLQLHIASTLKLPTPETTITNDPIIAAEILSRGATVVKGTSGYHRISPFVADLERNMVDAVQTLPVMLQRRVPAQAHLRVLVCGADAIAWRRDCSPDDPPDWRQVDPRGTGFVPTAVTDNLGQSAVDFVKAMSLSTSVQDWAVDEDGRNVFLESNPQGAWLFLNGAEDTALPMFCEHLMRME